MAGKHSRVCDLCVDYAPLCLDAYVGVGKLVLSHRRAGHVDRSRRIQIETIRVSSCGFGMRTNDLQLELEYFVDCRHVCGAEGVKILGAESWLTVQNPARFYARAENKQVYI